MPTYTIYVPVVAAYIYRNVEAGSEKDALLRCKELGEQYDEETARPQWRQAVVVGVRHTPPPAPPAPRVRRKLIDWPAQEHLFYSALSDEELAQRLGCAVSSIKRKRYELKQFGRLLPTDRNVWRGVVKK